MNPRAHGRRRSRGHTLIELLIVGVILSIVSMILMQGASPMASSTLRLRDRNYSSNEVRMVAETLLQDMGGAETVRIQGGRLHIDRYDEVLSALGLGIDDLGIEYTTAGTDLYRDDLEVDTSVLIARNVLAFDVERVIGVGISVTVTVGTGDGERTAEIIWAY